MSKAWAMFTRSTRTMSTSALLLATLSTLLLAGGCSSRRISITSEPSGATVTVNDVEIGRTPVEADFTYYGVYDVLVTKEGFEPLRTKARASAPIYEYPPVDLAMRAEEFEKQLMDRARAMRDDGTNAPRPAETK
jgi:hypothetical protein